MIEEITITSLSGRGSIVIRRGDPAGYWLGEVDWGQAEGQHQTYSYYNQIGESIVSTSLLPRPLSVTGWMIDGRTDTMQARCDTLNAFLSPAEDYVLEYRDRKLLFRPDRSIRYSREYRKNNELLRQFLIQGTAPYPLFTGLEDTVVSFDQSGKLFRFPTNFGRVSPLVFGTINRSYSTEAVNTGGFQTGLTAIVKFAGEVVNFRLELSSQLQHHAKENLIGRFPTEAFARTSIQFGSEGREVIIVEGFQIDRFGAILAD